MSLEYTFWKYSSYIVKEYLPWPLILYYVMILDRHLIAYFIVSMVIRKSLLVCKSIIPFGVANLLFWWRQITSMVIIELSSKLLEHFKWWNLSVLNTISWWQKSVMGLSWSGRLNDANYLSLYANFVFIYQLLTNRFVRLSRKITSW